MWAFSNATAPFRVDQEHEIDRRQLRNFLSAGFLPSRLYLRNEDHRGDQGRQADYPANSGP
jgi:hypothetical protein